jgi:hypothetical protein
MSRSLPAVGRQRRNSRQTEKSICSLLLIAMWIGSALMIAMYLQCLMPAASYCSVDAMGIGIATVALWDDFTERVTGR